MKYRPASNINAARHIAKSAQDRIKSKTGEGVSVLLCPGTYSLKTPQRMLYIISTALGMSYDCYKMKTRERNIAELRFLGAYFLRAHFPRMTLHQIAALFGGLDHSSVINGLIRANNLIYTGDTRFVTKYTTALKAIDTWLKKEVSAYELAASA